MFHRDPEFEAQRLGKARHQFGSSQVIKHVCQFMDKSTVADGGSYGNIDIVRITHGGLLDIHDNAAASPRLAFRTMTVIGPERLVGRVVDKADSKMTPCKVFDIQGLEHLPRASIGHFRQAGDSFPHFLGKFAFSAREQFIFLSEVAFLEFFPAPAGAGIIPSDLSHHSISFINNAVFVRLVGPAGQGSP